MSRHRVWKFGADIDTDALAPGAYMKLGIEGIAPHCLERIRPEFAAQARSGDVIVAGPNFGIGSSREQAAAALIHLGIKAVVAPSFGGLFFRNAFNLGLLLFAAHDAGRMEDGDTIRIDMQGPTIEDAAGYRLACEPIPRFLLDMVAAGGLFNQLRLQLASQRAAGTQPIDG